ncbi:uncharacterized protein K452DRAFT_293407, partial [Aplosporella prunicola CBS 121167]
MLTRTVCCFDIFRYVFFSGLERLDPLLDILLCLLSPIWKFLLSAFQTLKAGPGALVQGVSNRVVGAYETSVDVIEVLKLLTDGPYGPVAVAFVGPFIGILFMGTLYLIGIGAVIAATYSALTAKAVRAAPSAIRYALHNTHGAYADLEAEYEIKNAILAIGYPLLRFSVRDALTGLRGRLYGPYTFLYALLKSWGTVVALVLLLLHFFNPFTAVPSVPSWDAPRRIKIKMAPFRVPDSWSQYDYDVSSLRAAFTYDMGILVLQALAVLGSGMGLVLLFRNVDIGAASTRLRSQLPTSDFLFGREGVLYTIGAAVLAISGALFALSNFFPIVDLLVAIAFALRDIFLDVYDSVRDAIAAHPLWSLSAAFVAAYHGLNWYTARNPEVVAAYERAKAAAWAWARSAFDQFVRFLKWAWYWYCLVSPVVALVSLVVNFFLARHVVQLDKSVADCIEEQVRRRQQRRAAEDYL